MMKRYDKYKKSGIPWIGNIPEHWEVQRAKNMFIRMNRKVRESDDIITCFRDGVVTLRANRRTEGFTESFKEIGYQGIRRGDLVIHQMDAFAGAIGVSDSDGKGTPVYICLQPLGDFDNEYYAFLLREMARAGYIKSLYRGIRERSSDFRYETFAKLFLPLPPLAEQEAIVAYLEEKVAQMDSLVAKQEAQIAYLRELKQAIIARAVTQGLDPHAPLRPSGIPWIGAIPKHWEVQRLGRCFGENRSLNSDLECTEAYKFNYGSLIRKDENINPQELVDTYTKYTLLRENDIIINGLNLNYDFVTQRVAIATQKGIITSAYLTLSPRRGINHNYYCLLFKAMDSMKLFHGMGSGIRLTLSYKDLKNQCLPLPPLSEQEAIVTYINRKTEEIDRLIAMTEQEIARVRELKQTLIADVVTGRINVQPS